MTKLCDLHIIFTESCVKRVVWQMFGGLLQLFNISSKDYGVDGFGGYNLVFFVLFFHFSSLFHMIYIYYVIQEF